MPTHIACLTFDFDAMYGMVARGLKTPTPVSRGEFGAVSVPRILELLERWNIPTTWFIPGVVIETYPDLCRRIADAGHEIGNHGWTHIPPAELSAKAEEEGLVRANAAITDISGVSPQGYRSPSWDLSPATVGLLLKHGFVFDSSMMGHDSQPYFARDGDVVSDDEPIRFGPVTSLLEMPISWSLDDFPHFEYLRTATHLAPGLANAGLVLENFLDDFAYMTETESWGVLTYTFHPFVIGRGHRMRMLDNLIRGLSDRGAEFLRMQDAVAAFLARNAETASGADQ
ncbi:MAG: polysaccharide deacetylase [Rhodospirillaceae bacterium]|nr:polysaccharide deacetylase [Rhodospirillaceae bacterium]HAA92321.1 polysaccharide deacetylase [Rhodospirillaceae bacterium]